MNQLPNLVLIEIGYYTWRINIKVLHQEYFKKYEWFDYKYIGCGYTHTVFQGPTLYLITYQQNKFTGVSELIHQRFFPQKYYFTPRYLVPTHLRCGPQDEINVLETNITDLDHPYIGIYYNPSSLSPLLPPSHPSPNNIVSNGITSMYANASSNNSIIVSNGITSMYANAIMNSDYH